MNEASAILGIALLGIPWLFANGLVKAGVPAALIGFFVARRASRGWLARPTAWVTPPKSWLGAITLYCILGGIALEILLYLVKSWPYSMMASGVVRPGDFLASLVVVLFAQAIMPMWIIAVFFYGVTKLWIREIREKSP
jgi:hypothetical protein